LPGGWSLTKTLPWQSRSDDRAKPLLRERLTSAKRKYGWTVPQLIDRLAQVGVTVALANRKRDPVEQTTIDNRQRQGSDAFSQETSPFAMNAFAWSDRCQHAGLRD